jgi:hypothetical protein
MSADPVTVSAVPLPLAESDDPSDTVKVPCSVDDPEFTFNDPLVMVSALLQTIPAIETTDEITIALPVPLVMIAILTDPGVCWPVQF